MHRFFIALLITPHPKFACADQFHIRYIGFRIRCIGFRSLNSIVECGCAIRPGDREVQRTSRGNGPVIVTIRAGDREFSACYVYPIRGAVKSRNNRSRLFGCPLPVAGIACTKLTGSSSTASSPQPVSPISRASVMPQSPRRLILSFIRNVLLLIF